MPSGPALLITRDEWLRDDLLRLAAAAGSPLDVVQDAAEGLRSWSTASVVLVGADLVGALARHRPPRRDEVHVVSGSPLPEEVFRAALEVAALDVLELPSAGAWLAEVLSDAADEPGAAQRPPGRHCHTIGVVAGSGGAGATTFACAIALTAARSERAVLVDLDPLGPGLDRVVGLDGATGVRWDGLSGSRGRLGSRSLRAALPDRSGLGVLTWEAGAPVVLEVAGVREVLSAARRGNDVVVLDLPRTMDEVAAEMTARCDRVLVVTDPSVPGVASASKVAALLGPLSQRLGLVVRSGRGVVPAPQVGKALGLPVVAEVGHQRRLAEHVGLGLGPVHGRRSPLAGAARAVLGDRDPSGTAR